jgi:hypothetical protein
VHHRQGRLKIGVLQVGVKLAQLRGGEHPLIDHAVGGEDADVEIFAGGGRERGAELDHVLRALADEIEATVKVGAVEEGLAGGDEHLPDARHALEGGAADDVLIHRHITPAQHHHAVLAYHVLEGMLGFQARAHVAGEEDHAAGVLPGGREADADLSALLAEKLVGRAHHDAGAVAGIDFAAAGSAVRHVLKHAQGVVDDGVRRLALHVADETNATSVMFVRRVIQALCGR